MPLSPSMRSAVIVIVPAPSSTTAAHIARILPFVLELVVQPPTRASGAG